MPTTGSKGKPVLAGTDAFAPYTHINNAVNWAETFASVRNVADSTAMNALTGTDLWVGLVVYHTSGTYAGTYWRYTGSWKMLGIGDVPRFAATRSADQSIPNDNATSTMLLWTSTTENVGGFSYNSSTGIITVPLAGRYSLSAVVNFASNTTGRRRLDFVVNGTLSYGVNVGASPSGGQAMTVSAPSVRLSAGATIGAQVLQNSGGALAVLVSPTPPTIVIEYLGA